MDETYSGGESHCVGPFEFQTISWAAEIGIELAIPWFRHPVKEHLLDPNVVEKIFQMPERPSCAANMQVHCRSSVRRERHAIRLAQSGSFQEAADACTASRIGLQHIYRAGIEHSAEIPRIVAVLSGGDLHRRWSAVAHEPQALEIIR